MTFLTGKKTYFVAAGMVLYAVLGVAFGSFDWNHAADLIWQAAAIAGLRHGVSTTGAAK